MDGWTLKAMLATTKPEAAKRFYGEVLGLTFVEEHDFAILYEAFGAPLQLQKTPPFAPHPFTALGWDVPDIAAAARTLADRGVAFERFDAMEQDQLGVWSAPDGKAKVCWFKDPDGNLLSLSELM